MIGLKTIYDKNGIPLTDIRTRCVFSSLLNDYGEAVFSISYDDAKCKRNYLEFGNYILVRNEKLPPWLGMIDTPRIWRNGYVEIHAFELNLLLKYRYAPLNTVIEGTPGVKAVELLRLANLQESTIIRPGYIYSGGATYSQKMNESVLAHLKSIAVDNGHEWLISPVEAPTGRMYAELSWHERAGVETGLTLSQGFNVAYGETPMEENGELVNHVETVVDPDSNTEAGAQTYSYSESTSYGKRAVRLVLNGSIDSAGLETMARQRVSEKRNPSLSMPLGIMDVGDTFEKIALGNVVSYKLPLVGFANQIGFGTSKKVRILGYRFDELTKFCELTVGEV